jgi:hypothetical protein
MTTASVCIAAGELTLQQSILYSARGLVITVHRRPETSGVCI